MINLQKIKSKKPTKALLEFGILNLDKSSGPTSFNVSEFVKKELGARKTSHFGTLDPKVTGVLPVAINRACKLTGFFLGEDKEYVGIMRFHEPVSVKDVKDAIKEKFLGVITQLPPVKSRVKRQEREREIKSFKILENGEKDFLFQVACQGGTYIRKLVHDLGETLEVGAHMLELRRVRAGIFKEFDEKYPLVNLYDFKKAVDEYKKGDDKLIREMIIPGEIVSKILPEVQLKKEHVGKVFHGSPIYKEYLKNSKDSEKDDEKFSVFSEERFIGIFKKIKDKRIFAKPDFVFQPIK